MRTLSLRSLDQKLHKATSTIKPNIKMYSQDEHLMIKLMIKNVEKIYLKDLFLFNF